MKIFGAWSLGNKSFSLLFAIRVLLSFLLIFVHKTKLQTLREYKWPLEPEVDGKKDLVQPNEKHYGGIPKFLLEPHSLYYVNKSHPAVITCIAEPVSHVNIFCADKQFSYMEKEISDSGLQVTKLDRFNKIDPKSKKWKFSLSVKFKDVIEWFSEYKCYCEAWNQIAVINKDKKVHSSVALIQESYFQSQFKKHPNSQNLLEGERLELTCLPPDSKPIAKVTWLKDGKPLVRPTFPLMMLDEFRQLIIDRVRKRDAGNYTCVAQSLGVVKKSKPAVIIIAVKYHWSPWTEFRPCPMICQNEEKCNNEICSEVFKQRNRFCVYDESKTDTSHCEGNSNEDEMCDKGCKHPESKWKSWSMWSTTCYPNCSQSRLRICETGKCFGLKTEYRNCSQNQCQLPALNLIESQSITMYLGLFVTISILLVAILIILCIITQKGYISLLPRPAIVFSSHNNGSAKSSTNENAKNGEKPLLYKDPKTVVPALKNSSAQDMIPKSLLTDEHNNYSPVYEMHSHNNRDQVIPAIYSEFPLISQSQYSYNATNPLLNTALSPERPYKELLEINKNPTIIPALYQELSIGRGSCGLLSNYLPPVIELDAVAWGTITNSGGRLCLPRSAISLTIPRSAIQPGNSEEMFLAVCRDHTFLPAIDMMEMLLSPVILCGPHHIRLQKPFILTLPHCANTQCSDWNIRVLSARFQNNQIPPLWKELSTSRPVNRSDTNIYAQLDSTSAHLILDQLQMICITGSPTPVSESVVSIRLRVIAFSLPLSTNVLDHVIQVHLIPDTKEAMENVISAELKNNGQLLDSSKKFSFLSSGGDIVLSLDDLSFGWRCHSSSKIQTFPYSTVWKLNHNKNMEVRFHLDHTDPSRSGFSCQITVRQIDIPQNQIVIRVVKEKSLNARTAIPISNESHTLNDEFSQLLFDPLQTVFRLSFSTRQQLWPLLDPNWQALANLMLLNGNLNYFSMKKSPSDALLDLWEARNREEGAIADLVNMFRVLGRNDCAILVEDDVVK